MFSNNELEGSKPNKLNVNKTSYKFIESLNNTNPNINKNLLNLTNPNLDTINLNRTNDHFARYNSNTNIIANNNHLHQSM